MDADKAAEWLREHQGAVIASDELSAAFYAYLLTLPWVGLGLDWSDIPHVSFSLDHASDDQVLAWARQTGAALHAYLLLCDSASSPGIVCRFEDGIRDWDSLSYLEGFLELYMCGVDLADGRHQPCYGHFIELRAAARLNAPLLDVQHS